MGPADTDQLRQAIAADAGLDRVAGTIAGIDRNAPPSDELVIQLDRLADDVSDTSTAGILRYVFSTLGFAGNMGRYYQASNSLLHRVLERRLGNPLSLSIVTTELSRRTGGAMTVVGFPGHVLIGDDKHPTRWFDPFLGGAAMDLAGCRSLLARMHPGEAFHPSMVSPASPGDVATRILNNLDVAYRRTGDLARLVDIAELRLALPESGDGERRQLAHMLIAAGRPFRAVEVLTELSESDPENAEEYEQIRHRLIAHRN